ncbi:MAG: class I SAM-dependent methyltransferase, partial [Maribacter sp.]|nr:class I SAM-dependent methyltransferase [Maribacter sp.]
MNSEILASEVQQFINDNLSSDIHKILLSKSKFLKVSSKELVEQIESKLKSKTKLPSWFGSDNIYYPNKLNLSQTSS